MWQLGAAGAVFAVTFLFLALGRLGRLPLPRGLVALCGGLATWLLVDVSWRVIDLQVILLIVGLLVLASLAEEAGLLAGVRRRLDTMGPRTALFAGLVLTAGMSALLLNDAAIVILVPFLLPELRRQGLPLVRSVVLMAVAANLGSLLTPFGNPQNAVLASAARLSVVDFLRDQLLVVAAGLLILAIACWRTPTMPRDGSTLTPRTPQGRPWVLAALGLFLALASWRPAALGLGTAAAIAATLAWLGLRARLRRQADRAALRGVDGNVIALFTGLYLLTGGFPSWMPPVALGDHLGTAWTATAAVVVLSNVIGNVPAALTLLRIDEAWTVAHAGFLVTTTTLGGALLLTGSAASLLAADQARRSGVDVRFGEFLGHGWWALPMLLVGVLLNW